MFINYKIFIINYFIKNIYVYILILLIRKLKYYISFQDKNIFDIMNFSFEMVSD